MRIMDDAAAVKLLETSTYPLQTIDGERYRTIIHPDGSAVEYPESEVVEALKKTVFFAGARNQLEQSVHITDFLLLTDLYPMRQIVLLVGGGYSAEELIAAHENGIDLSLLESLKIGSE